MHRTAARNNGRSAGRFLDLLSSPRGGASVLITRKRCVVEFRLAGGIMIYLLTLQASALLYRLKYRQIPPPRPLPAAGSLGAFMDIAFSEHHSSDGASVQVIGTGKSIEYALIVCR